MVYEELINKLEEMKGEKLEDFISKMRDWATLHGIGMRPGFEDDDGTIIVAPFTILPSPISRSTFERAVSAQTVLNSLLHQLAYDPHFLQDALSKTIEYDEFTRRLFNIYTTVKNEGFAQPVSCGLLRSDYLGDSDGQLKQVETNTIASSMAGLIGSVVPTHRFVLRELDLEEHLSHIPENNALSSMAGGLIKAWEVYNVESAVILFIVEEAALNICDQRFIEFEIGNQNRKAKVLRRSFSQLISKARLTQDKRLFVGDIEVAVVYFRYGYDPSQYEEESCWDLRLLMERSKAIKCPSIQYHLIGTKKVQQVLSEPGVLEKYLPDKESLELIKGLFVELYPLDQSPEGEKGYQLAMKSPEKYVLKPQREGGGNNVYSNDIPQYLKELSREEASAFILMRLIEPQPTKNILVRPESYRTVSVVSELGIYGIVLGDEKELILNKSGGHMIRSKDSLAREGGIIAGEGFLDSPYLV